MHNKIYYLYQPPDGPERMECVVQMARELGRSKNVINLRVKRLAPGVAFCASMLPGRRSPNGTNKRPPAKRITSTKLMAKAVMLPWATMYEALH